MIMPDLRGIVHRLAPLCLAGACLGLLSVPALAPTARAEPDPGWSAGPTPTDTASPTDPATDPVPVPTGTPDPVAGVRAQATDLVLGDGYWRGTGNSGDVTISVTNTANPATAEDVQLAFTLPPGVSQVRAATSAGCAGGGQSYTCTLPGGGTASLVLHLTVGPGAWRDAPLRGTATARATVSGRADLPPATANAGYAVLLPPGPPVPGIRLTASDVVVGPADRAPARLTVRLANLGSVGAAGAVELVVPPGAELAEYPPECTRHRRVADGRDRCEVGRLEPGREQTLGFTLAVSEQALAQAPLTGAVYGFLTPDGQDTVLVQAVYRITVAGADTVASPTPTQSPAARVAVPRHPVPPATDSLISRQISAGSVIGGLVTLVALAVALFVLSLRRRFRDADPVPPSGGEASM